ncbi:MAG TPA: sodium:solute symporter [Gemmatimonadales bacterium]|nr:sodium:solute symporter [Gemmatimonadales bacterium]
MGSQGSISPKRPQHSHPCLRSTSCLRVEGRPIHRWDPSSLDRHRPPLPLTPHPLLFVILPRDPALHAIDLAIVVVYVALTLGIGAWAARSQKSSGDYFLGARDLPAFAVLLSIVATETSALTVVSIPGLGARTDLTFLQVVLGYIVGRIGVAAWLLPGYFAHTQETAYERLEKRFGQNTRRLAAAVFIVTRFLGDAVRVFAGAIPLALLTGWNIPLTIIILGCITVAYTWHGGLKAVVWTDVVQLAVYVAGGLTALFIAVGLAGGWSAAWGAASAAGKLTLLRPELSFTAPYTLLAGVLGGALLSAASHGTDHLIVQRLLATRSLRDGRIALVGSGFAVFFQFLLFLSVGVAIWAAGNAPDGVASDTIFPAFVVSHFPVGLSGLLVAGILAASMCSHSSAISALASSTTYDLYATWTGTTDQGRLLKVGKGLTIFWGVALILGSLGFHYFSTSGTPIVVLALSIASVTYGGLLGAYILAGRWPRATGRDVIGAIATTTLLMLVVIFAKTLAEVPAFGFLAPVGRLAWPWYVPLGTGLALLSGAAFSYLPRNPTPSRTA